MTIKKLPLGHSPIIGYQHHAYPLSICSLHPSFEEWFYCNYIQLVCNPTGNQLLMNFYEYGRINPKSPLLGEMYLPKTLIAQYINPMRFIEDAIRNGHYIVTFVDEFYIPGRYAYEKFHNVHDILVYGYDKLNHTLNVAGYDAHAQYQLAEVYSGDFEMAFNEIKTTSGALVKWADGIHLYQLKTDESFHIDIEIIVELMEDYLFSRDSSKRFAMYDNPVEQIYGMDVYDAVVLYLQSIKDENIDIRIPHIIFEHKKCMVARLRYIKEKITLNLDAYLIDQYISIEQETLKARNLSLKYKMTNKPEYLGDIALLYEKVKKEETILLSKIITFLMNALQHKRNRF